MDSFTFTVGKLDAGMAILIGERAHLIEFPSLLLPPGTTCGSIVNVSVHRNLAEEKRQRSEFWQLQDQIHETFGLKSPKPPQLQIRNLTQTSATLEWPPLDLATAKLRSLDIYKNGQRLTSIPSPLQNTSTKLSGLELNTDYSFQLVLHTTAGNYPSNLIKIKTHTMSDTSGISVCFGNVQDGVLLEHAKLALQEMKAKWSDKVQIDTTHFVCTTPAVTPLGASASGGLSNAPGVEYQKALQASIPIVLPHWVLECHQQQKMVPISQFYLGATPSTTLNAKPFARPSASSKSSTPASSTGTSSSPNITPFVNQLPNPPRSPESRGRTLPDSEGTALASSSKAPAQIPVQSDDGSPTTSPKSPTSDGGRKGAADRAGKPAKRRTGTMQRDFRFPPSADSPPPLPKDTPPPPAIPAIPTVKIVQPSVDMTNRANGSVDIPPPVPKEKPTSGGSLTDGDDDIGVTEEIDLS